MCFSIACQLSGEGVVPISNINFSDRSIWFICPENWVYRNKTKKFSTRLDGRPDSTIIIMNSATDLGVKMSYYFCHIDSVTTHIGGGGQITLFWVVALCSSVNWYKYFVGTSRHTDWLIVSRNVTLTLTLKPLHSSSRWWQSQRIRGTYLPNYSALFPEKSNIQLPPQEPRILHGREILTFLLKCFYISWSKIKMKYKNMIHRKWCKHKNLYSAWLNKTAYTYILPNTQYSET
jgi:hypothetical protein